jgi:aquaporin Z
MREENPIYLLMEPGDVSCRNIKGAAAVFFYEAFGTFILLTAINFSAYDPFVVPCGLFIAAITCGSFTGGHFNLAVTIAVFINQSHLWRSNLPLIFLYFLAQLFGGFIAQTYCYAVLGIGDLVWISPSKKLWNFGYVMVIEMIFTFIFLMAICHAKTSKLALFHNGVTGTISVIMGLYFSVKCAGAYSGAALNPSVAIANNVTLAIINNDSTYMRYLGAYIIGPIIGGCLAAIFTKNVSLPIVTKQCGEQEESIWKKEQFKHFMKQQHINFSNNTATSVSVTSGQIE